MAEHGIGPSEGYVAEAAIEPSSGTMRQRMHRVSLPVAIAHERRAALAHPTPATADASDLVCALFVLRVHVSEARAHAPERPVGFLQSGDIIARRRFSRLRSAFF